MGTNGVCIINNGVLPLSQNLGPYPKSKDQYGNVYFGCGEGVDGQATRIAFRELCSSLGYRDSRGPEPAFYVLNEMSLMFISGIELNSEHMIELRKLAIIQTSMEAIIAKDKYDGIGLYKQWQAGKTLATNYLKPTQTHSSLYGDRKINPLKLEEPIWWALMMSMLGLFDEQKNTYQTALLAHGINDCSDFLAWIRDTYKDTVHGRLALYTLNPLPTSVFTLENFETGDEVYVLKKHGVCDTKTCYSKDEINSYVLTSGCVWCYHRPSWPDFIPCSVDGTNQMEQLSKLITDSSKLHVPIDVGAVEPVGVVGGNKKIIINMIGITGSGKSTASKKIYDLVTGSGGLCLIVSADKWSKKGTKGKQLQSSINKEIRDFDSAGSASSAGSPDSIYKVIVIDICNENGPSSNCFGFNTSSYSSFNFYPNLNKDKFDDYQCWSLRNVLMRTACTATSLYWLNPESAGVSTCIKVHNLKVAGLKMLLGVVSGTSFNESLSMDDVMSQISERANAYEHYLTTKNPDELIIQLIKSTGFTI
jgi:ABC-type oligopeptide transport system ATPase subunit